VNAVIHVHDEALWEASLGRVPTTPADVAYGTPAMAREIARLLVTREYAERGVAAMAGHEGGLLATGATLERGADRILAYRDSIASG
jgi:L-ribulose-5-phosphate 4-epimerase